MSLSIQHVRCAKLVRHNYESVNQARLDVLNTRPGEVTDYWNEQGCEGFLFQPLSLASYSVFLLDNGVVYEVRMYSHFPID